MATTYLLALDQGTSSSRSILFSTTGELICTAQRELTQYYPQPGWVEHDADELWQSQLATVREVLQQSGVSAHQIAALGISNQRETTLLWHRKTGRPLHRAIVWQDRRTADACAQLRQQLAQSGQATLLQEKTGLLPDPYFSASKLQWLLDHIPGARAMAERGELAFGTVDTWLTWQLSEASLHVTDVSNAARTLLWNIHQRDWDQDCLDLFDIPRSLLPTVLPSSHRYGDCHLFGAPIPIGGIAGDQQAALFGQACFQAGMAKNTYGTGCFMLLNTGHHAITSQHGLITTAACQLDADHRADGTVSARQPAQYALEGSVFIGGAVVQWLRDGLQIIQHASQIETLASSVPDSAGVLFVPAFTGLGAPYWDAEAKGAILGITRGTTQAHIARAAVEAIAYQSAALLFAMQADMQSPATPDQQSHQQRQTGNNLSLKELRVDGGAANNQLLLQFQADLLGIPVIRPKITETTALGAAYLAGLAVGVFQNQDECAAQWQEAQRFLPRISRAEAQQYMQDWERAVQRVRHSSATPAAAT